MLICVSRFFVESGIWNFEISTWARPELDKVIVSGPPRTRGTSSSGLFFCFKWDKVYLAMFLTIKRRGDRKCLMY
jgi:hypothetical protein